MCTVWAIKSNVDDYYAIARFRLVQKLSVGMLLAVIGACEHS